MSTQRRLLFAAIFILFVLAGAAAAAERNQSPIIYLPSIQGGPALQFELVAPLPNVSDLAAVDGWLYATTLEGFVYRLDPRGQAAPDIFLDIRDRVEFGASEQGLLGLALHPRFAENGYFYVYYTVSAEDDAPTVLSRFTATGGGVGDPATEQRLLIIPRPVALHYGGGLEFGPDGYLYVAAGDGFIAAPGHWPNPPHAQYGGNLLGKILRLDVDNTGGAPYAIPPDNPFVSDEEIRDEIWLLGLRNPWRFSFDRLTGDLYIGDVGWNKWEEINVVPAGVGGLNLGWPCYEGHVAGPAPDGCGPAADYHFPTHAYDHLGGRCAIIGGFVYRGQALPWLTGRYLFADICSSEIWALEGAGAGQQVKLLGVYPNRQWSTFGQDESGELYVAGIGLSPGIYRLTP